MNTTRNIAIAALALAPLLAAAQMPKYDHPLIERGGWIRVAATREGDAQFVSPYRIRQLSADRFSVWIKKVYGRSGTDGGQAQRAEPGYAYSLMRYEYDCAARTAALQDGSHHADEGTVVEEWVGDRVHKAPHADSLGYASLRAVCMAAAETVAR